MLDPYGHFVALPHTRTLYPMGYAVALSTNDERVIEAAAEDWRHYDQFADSPPIELRVIVGEENATAALPPLPVFRGFAHLLGIVSDNANFALCDLDRGKALCRVIPDVAANPDWLRYYFLDAIVLATLTQQHVTAIHAACLTWKGRGVLLCASSGTGKSTLSFACARRGWTFVSDDVGFLVRAGGREVIGRPHRIRFLPNAVEFFPELFQWPAIPDVKGEDMIEVPTAELGIRSASRCPPDFVVFLRRVSRGGAHLRPVAPVDALDRMLAELTSHELSVRDQHAASLARLLRAGAFELEYADLDDAANALERMVESGPAAW